MLTLEENLLNFKTFKICSTLNLFPIEIDTKPGKFQYRIQRQSNQIRIWLWRLFFFVAVADGFYVVCRLVHSTILEPEKYFRWDHFVVHAPFALGYPLVYYTAFCLFEKNWEECMLILNQLFVKKENPVQKMMGQEQEEQKEGASTLVSVIAQPQAQVRVRSLFTWPPQYSVDEILTKTFVPYMSGGAVMEIILFSVDPTRPQLLYSSLPPDYQNLYSFFGLWTLESIFISFYFFVVDFAFVCQLLFFAKCQAEFHELGLQLRTLKEKFQSRELENRDNRKEIWILRQILKETKELVVFIELFNRCFPPCIFAFKQLWLGLSILYYFFSIRHAHDFPFLAAFTGYCAVLLTVSYTILYDKAFSIPEKMEELKTQLILCTRKSTMTTTTAQNFTTTRARGNAETNSKSTLSNNSSQCKNFRSEMKRQIKGVRDVGVKVGSFHTLERESTPNFLDFVVNQVVGLLVTFPR